MEPGGSTVTTTEIYENVLQLRGMKTRAHFIITSPKFLHRKFVLENTNHRLMLFSEVGINISQSCKITDRVITLFDI
jgi:hypothetical protein